MREKTKDSWQASLMTSARNATTGRVLEEFHIRVS